MVMLCTTARPSGARLRATVLNQAGHQRSPTASNISTETMWS